MIGLGILRRLRGRLVVTTRRLKRDERGIAATEFAVIVPLMLMMFFGTVEMSSGVAVDRKVTLIARTISDLVSQSTTVQDSDFTNFFAASNLIMWPYGATPINATVSQLYVNPTTLKATVQWSKAYGSGAVRSNGSQVAIPTALATAGTYLIYSEVNYRYVPAVGYLMNKLGVTLSDTNYTRPRQSTCVLYGTSSCTTT